MRGEQRSKCSLGPAEAWELREREETLRKRPAGEMGRDLEKPAEQRSRGKGLTPSLEKGLRRVRRPKLRAGWSAPRPPRLGFL